MYLFINGKIVDSISGGRPEVDGPTPNEEGTVDTNESNWRSFQSAEPVFRNRSLIDITVTTTRMVETKDARGGWANTMPLDVAMMDLAPSQLAAVLQARGYTTRIVAVTRRTEKWLENESEIK